MDPQDVLHITASRGPTGVTPCPAAEIEQKVEASKETILRSQARPKVSKLRR